MNVPPVVNISNQITAPGNSNACIPDGLVAFTSLEEEWKERMTSHFFFASSIKFNFPSVDRYVELVVPNVGLSRAMRFTLCGRAQ